MQEYRIEYVLNEIDRVAGQFLSLMHDKRHFAFYGQMGAGKTTFITSLCHKLDTADLVSSPTFAIINEYKTQKGQDIFHFDFYRINNPTELLDIGFYDYCKEDSFCFIEWPERAEEILPEDFIRVTLQIADQNSRILSFSL
jgi:tRNA threonylcarbamoyladenosine biosynthesis protein TsaE